MACPFASMNMPSPHGNKDQAPAATQTAPVGKCPFGKNDQAPAATKTAPAGKCPFGYDSGSAFKIGPLSCVLCRALLYNTIKCVPCGHIFCRVCISRFQDCPLCGAGIESVEPHDELQTQVDQFIEGHARVKRTISQVDGAQAVKDENSNSSVIYEDVSLERGTFLVQQAMRAFQALNLESANARLSICAADIKEELVKNGPSSEVCSQLGAVLGMLGDCCRSMGKVEDSLQHYEESVEMLSKLQDKDAEVVHALSVSLNKIGDLKYYADDLQSARAHYARSLEVRRNALTSYVELSSQVLDIAVSLAKVADVDRVLGNNTAASEGFQEAIKMLESTSGKSKEDDSLERKRISILEFLHSQMSGSN